MTATPPRPWTKPEIERLRLLWNNGATIQIMSTTHNRTPSAIYRVAHEYEFPKRRAGAPYKPHCPNHHHSPMIVQGNGRRRCLECVRVYAAKYRLKRRLQRTTQCA